MSTHAEALLQGATVAPLRRGRGLLRTAGALVGGLGLAGLAAGGAALAWGSIERTMPVLRRYDVPVRAHVPEVTILQIADLHLFPGQEFLLRFLSDVAASEHFDMVVATGDNFGSVDALDMVMEAYRPFLSYPGAFVLGSNDYYSPIHKRWSRYLSRSKPRPARVVPDLPYLPMVHRMRQAGWLDLSNASGTLHLPTGTVSLLGTDDAHIHRDRLGAPASSWATPDALRLGVTHAPYTRVISALTSTGSDLILAGHTHGGQIGIPGVGAIITNCDISRSYAKGLKRWKAPDGAEAWLHVSAGLGTSPYAKVRIATRPEASLLHVHPA
mgnify:FL=1